MVLWYFYDLFILLLSLSVSLSLSVCVFFQVGVCETSDNEDNPQFNAKIMTYLRKHVPKMFQVSE